MSRERLTGKDRKAEIIKTLDTLKGLVAEDDAAMEKVDVKAVETADVDADLAAQADAISKADMAAVNQSTSTDVTLKDEGDQNAKANANWTLTDAEREKVASTLINLAESLMGK